MKRFVDLRLSDIGWRFAWWDTVFDHFETHGGAQAWNTFDDFAAHYEGAELARYRGLCASWAFSQQKTASDALWTAPTDGRP